LRNTIKKALICGIILLQFVTLTTLLVSNYFSNQRSFNSHAHKLMIDYADNVIDNSKRFLDTAQASTRLTGELLGLDVLSIDRSEDLSLYFYQQLKQSSHLSGIFFADINGKFVHVQREQGFEQPLFTRKFILVGDDIEQQKESRLYTHDVNFAQISVKQIFQESYDPRDRIWFNKALENNALSWTDPYVFFSSRKPGITSSMPVYDTNNKLIGVVGVDVSHVLMKLITLSL
jgi:putative two-component system response regulator